MKTFVTGASGFLGHAVCTELIGAGHDVAALVRRPGSEPSGTTAAAGDLSDGALLGERLAAAEAECVIHLAAEIATQRDPARIDEVNVAGTRRLLEASESAGVRRFLFASTVVTGDGKGQVLDESSQLPVETAYGGSKQEGERLVAASHMETVILRPSHVYGAGGWYAEEIVARLRSFGRFAVIGSGRNWWDVVRVEDVARAFVLAAERAEPGSLFHVVDDEPITQYDFAALTAEALGVGPPRRVPAWLASLAAGSGPIAAVTRSGRSSNALIKRELGWEPRWASSRQGIPDAVARLATV